MSAFDSLITIGKQILPSNPDSALVLLTQAQSHSSNKQQEALVLRYMANAYHYKDDFKQSIAYCNQAIDIRNNVTHSDSSNIANLAILNYNIAINYNILGLADSAIVSARRAAELYKECGNEYSEGICYDFVAQLYQHKGESFLAQQFAYAELSISEKLLDSIGIAYTKDLLSKIMDDRRIFDEELQLQKEALDIRLKLSDSVMIAQSYNNIGLTFVQLEEYDSALYYLNLSLKLKESFNQNQAYQIAISQETVTLDYQKYWRESILESAIFNIGSALQKKGEPREALTHLTKAYEYRKKLGLDYNVAEATLTIGLAYQDLHNTQKAIQHLEECWGIANYNNYRLLKFKSAEGLSKEYAIIGNSTKAYKFCNIALTLIDSIRDESFTRKLALAESEYKYNKLHEADSIRQYHERLTLDIKHKNELKQKKIELLLLSVFIVAIIIISVILFRNYRLRKMNEQAELKHKALEIERSLLRTQMNPHFIFNALNSIQNFIINNEPRDAERYLSKFAKLMRMILDNSMNQRVPLENELLSLSLYIDLEKVRFGNRFNYHINVDDDIEEELVFVPPMLIQPFVENAILHGLINKTDSNGLITIDVVDNHDKKTLTCSITDNGIGRVAAAEFSKANKKHRSVGMQLTRDRLKDLNKETEGISCKIEDLYDSDGTAKGTKVTIQIPYIENV